MESAAGHEGSGASGLDDAVKVRENPPTLQRRCDVGYAVEDEMFLSLKWDSDEQGSNRVRGG